jgi:hypothetical protein
MKKILMSTVLSSALLFGAHNNIGTDYDKAIVSSFTEEATLDALETVNMILGFIRDSRASEFINKGNYIALQKPEETSGSTVSAGTSSKKVEKLNPMTLNVTRDTSDMSAPMIVKLWMDESDGPNDSPMRIIGHMSAYKGVDSEYPLGKITFHFAGFNINADGTKGSTKMMEGIMNIDKGANKGQATVDYKNMMNDGTGNLTEPEKIHLVLNVNASDANGDGDTTDDGEEKGNGVAYTLIQDYSSTTPTLKGYKLSLSEKFYKVQEVNATTGSDIGTAKVKEKANQLHKVYRYGVYYDTNGTKLELNSGFPIVEVGTNNHGYIGYWGLWSESDLIANGDTVKKEGSTDNATYTIVQAPGKLKKFTKSSAKLEKIDNTKMYIFNQNDGMQYIISWDKSAGGGNGNYKILGTQNDYGEAENIAGVSGKYLFSTGGDDNSTNPIAIQNWTSAWSEALNASVNVNSSQTNSTDIIFHKEEVVVPTSDLNLVNFGNEVINPSMNTSDLNNTASIREDGSGNVIGTTYTFSASTMTLVDSSTNPVVFATGADFSNTAYSWWSNGYQMGPLLESSQAGSYNGTNYWEVEQNEDVYYRWETGSNDWNKYNGIKDSSNQFLTFDAPKVFSYEHTTANDINGDTNNTGTYSLQYDGDSLQVPWSYDATNGWTPKINIKTGTAISDGTTTFRVKVLDEGITIGDATTYSGTPALIIPSDLTSAYVGDDHNSTLITNMGDVPTDANVTVIKGKCVKANCGM